jgi:hypothetical protein
MRGEVLIAPKLKQAYVARSSLAPVQEWRKWPRLGYALPPLLRRRARRWSKLVTVVFLSGGRPARRPRWKGDHLPLFTSPDLQH